MNTLFVTDRATPGQAEAKKVMPYLKSCCVAMEIVHIIIIFQISIFLIGLRPMTT